MWQVSTQVCIASEHAGAQGIMSRGVDCHLLLQMSHTKPYIRKKAVLIMYKVFLKYPESLRPAFPRLKEKLEDPDPGSLV